MKSTPLILRPQVSLIGEVNPNMVRDFTNQMKALHEKDVREAVLRVSSNGGFVNAGRALYAEIRQWEPHLSLTFFGVGIVNSAALLPMLAIPKERRFITPETVMLIHSYGSTTDSRGRLPVHSLLDLNRESAIDLRGLEKDNEWQCRMIAKDTGRPLKEILELCRESRFFLGKEAVEFGLIGGIA